MKQPYLFQDVLPPPAAPLPEPKQLARAEDPASSHLAAAAIAPDLPRLHAMILELVRKWPGYTSSELARANEIGDPRVINRRLGEMEDRGLVVRGPERKCKVTGRTAATWTAAE